jgi:hypothetical protein
MRRAEADEVLTCGFCSSELAMVTASEIRRSGDRPWCGWCEPEQKALA